MAQQIIEFAGVSIVVGMEWKLSQDKKDKKNIFSEEKGKSYVSIKKDPDEHQEWNGFSEAYSRNAYAGAALVAQAMRDVIVALPIDNEQTWIVVTHEGMPIPTKDLVIKTQDAYTTISDLMGIYSNASIYGEIHGANGTPKDLEELIVNFINSEESVKNKLKKIRLIKPASKKDIIITLILFCFLISTAVAYFIYQKYKPKDINSQQKNQEIIQEKNRRAAVEKSIRAHYFLLSQKQEFWRNQISKNRLTGWMNVINQLPQQLLGYRPTLVECEQDRCDVTWQAQGLQVKEAEKFKLPFFVETAPQSQSLGQAQSRYVTKTLEYDRVILALHEIGSSALARANLIDEFKLQGMSAVVENFQIDAVPGVPEAKIAPVEIAKTAGLKLTFSAPMPNTSIEVMMKKIALEPVVVDRLVFRPVPSVSMSYEISAKYVFLNTDKDEIAAVEWDDTIGSSPKVVLKK